MSDARIGVAEYAVFSQLLRRSNNTTGEVPNRPVSKVTGELAPVRKYAPRLATVFRQACVSPATGYRALDHLMKHGWVMKRFDVVNGVVKVKDVKFFGRLNVGEPCDCRVIAPTCKHCGKSLAHLRADARFCTARCKQAAYNAQKRARKVSVAVTSSRYIRDNVTDIAVTNSLSIRNKSQVSDPLNGNTRLENLSKENATVENGVGPDPDSDLLCPECDLPLVTSGDAAVGMHYECAPGCADKPDPWRKDGEKWQRWDRQHREGTWD